MRLRPAPPLCDPRAAGVVSHVCVSAFWRFGVLAFPQPSPFPAPPQECQSTPLPRNQQPPDSAQLPGTKGVTRGSPRHQTNPTSPNCPHPCTKTRKTSRLQATNRHCLVPSCPVPGARCLLPCPQCHGTPNRWARDRQRPRIMVARVDPIQPVERTALDTRTSIRRLVPTSVQCTRPNGADDTL